MSFYNFVYFEFLLLTQNKALLLLVVISTVITLNIKKKNETKTPELNNKQYSTNKSLK